MTLKSIKTIKYYIFLEKPDSVHKENNIIEDNVLVYLIVHIDRRFNSLLGDIFY